MATILLLTIAACGRINYDFLASDASSDASRVSDASSDAKVSQALVLTCDPPLPVLPTVSAFELVEPSYYTDHLTLVMRARAALPGMRQSTRPTVSGAFGDIVDSTLVPATMQDLSYLEYQGDTFAIASRMGDARQLSFCPMVSATSDCLDITVYDENGLAILDDLDGPTVGMQEDTPFMAFNRDTDIYLAQPRDATFLEWDAKRIVFPFPTDDPAMSDDGQFLLAGGEDGLYAMLWDADAATFGPATRVLTTGLAAPEIGRQTASSLELYYHAITRGITEPHMMQCEVSLRPLL